KLAGQKVRCTNCNQKLQVPISPKLAPEDRTILAPLDDTPHAPLGPPAAPGIIVLPPSAIVHPAPPPSPQSDPFEVVNTPASLVRPPVARRGSPVLFLAVIIPGIGLLLLCGVGAAGVLWLQ